MGLASGNVSILAVGLLSLVFREGSLSSFTVGGRSWAAVLLGCVLRCSLLISVTF